MRVACRWKASSAAWARWKRALRAKEDGSGAEGHLDHSQLLTDPDQAADFVKHTEVDALAIAIGTSHGAYKFSRPPTADILAIDRIKEIHRRIPDTHLVMHGSSSVPQDWLQVINAYGGSMDETYGVPVEEVRKAFGMACAKLTSIRTCAWLRRAPCADSPADTKEFDPRKWLAATTKAMTQIGKYRYEAFDAAGKASKIRPLAFDSMVARYERGELDPKVF